MVKKNLIQSYELQQFYIKIYEPFAEFLMADLDECQFTISLLDVVRFAGHACPAMIGAFLISKRAVLELFPESEVCVRGQVSIHIPSSVTQGATGPISNVFSMIFGAWEKSGFGGLQGQFVRKGLMQYNSAEVPKDTFRFQNITTGMKVDILYNPSLAETLQEGENLPFQKVWRNKITTILQNPNRFLTVTPA